MKKILILLITVAFAFNFSPVQSENIRLTALGQGDIVTEEMKVSGNCGMCKSRIEKAAKTVKGVKSAEWDVKTKMLTVSYNKTISTVDDIHKAISKAGHDTEKMKASDKVYNKLHGCCKYRK